MTDRKYGQRGYQDSDREKGAKRPQSGGGPQAPREQPQGPRGRGLGAPTATVFRCAACGVKQEVGAVVALDAVCARCGGDLHTCTNCLHFDTGAHNQCRAGVEPRVAKKSLRNTCETFAPKAAQEFAKESGPSGGGGSRPDDPRSAFDALFKI
jgi:hypothetical protein